MKKIKLDDIEKENIFRTPPDYFEDLPSIIQAKAIQSASEAWYLKLLKQPAVKFAVPAMLVLLLFVFRGNLFPPNNNTLSQTGDPIELLADVSTADLYAYVMDHTDVTHTDLLEIMTEDQHVHLSPEQSEIEIDEEYIEDLELEDLEDLM